MHMHVCMYVVRTYHARLTPVDVVELQLEVVRTNNDPGVGIKVVPNVCVYVCMCVCV